MNIVLLGQITSGKGTLAEALHEKYGYELVSIGALLREETKKNTPEAKIIDDFQREGKLVPEEIVLSVLKKHMEKAESKDLLFDGYPRNLHQAQTLEKIAKIDAVLILDVDDSIVEERFMGRRGCTVCGHITHVRVVKDSLSCPKCGGKLEIRNDMTKEAMLNKMKSFETETKPIISFYEGKGYAYHINAGENPESTLNQAEDILKRVKNNG